jgi:hypothetical protein
MKFTIFALVGALASVNARQLRTKARNLDGGGENNGRAALDGSAIIKFAKCVEVKVTPQDEDDDMKSAIQAGLVSSLESYAAFYTTTYATDDEMMMVGLGEYVAAKVNAIANVKQNTCETCREFQDTCYADEAEDADAEEEADEDVEEEAEDGADEEAEDGADEEAEGNERKLATAIDSTYCSMCVSLGCYVEDDGSVDKGQLVSEFVEQVAECMETEAQDTNGNTLYIGYACSAFGDAAEFAVFIDEDCTLETNQYTAAGILSSAADNENGIPMSTILTYTAEYMQKAFTTSMTCEQVEYYDPNQEQDNQNDNNNGDVQMAEACEQITNEAVYLADCEVEEADEEEAADEDYWYSFDVQNQGDIDEACGIAYSKFTSGEQAYFYDESKQGSTYKRGKGNALTSEEAGMSGGITFIIVALVAAIVIAPVAWLINSKKNTQASETDYQGGTLS